MALIEVAQSLKLMMSSGYAVGLTCGRFVVYNVSTQSYGSYGSTTKREWMWTGAAGELQPGSGKYAPEGTSTDQSPLEQIQGDGILVTLHGNGNVFPIGFWNAQINSPQGSWMRFETKNAELVACKFAAGLVAKKTLFGGTKNVHPENTYATLDTLHFKIMQFCDDALFFKAHWAEFIQNYRTAQGYVSDRRL